MKKLPIILLSLLALLLAVTSAVFGVLYIKEKNEVIVPDSVPLVDLSVDVSRAERDGVIEYTLTNNSSVNFEFEKFRFFAFKDGKWQEIIDSDKESKHDYIKYYPIEAGQVLTNEMSVEMFEPGVKYMILADTCPIYSWSGEADCYLATAVFEVPERD